VLHLAATTSEGDVEAALSLLLDLDQLPTLAAARGLVQPPRRRDRPVLTEPTLNLAIYDQLLATRGAA